jgi:putative ABC transport system permease protein
VWRFDQLHTDVRGSFRLWRKRPLVAAAVLLTIALGTGMNIALFRVVWSALLKPLPYPDAARLVQVWRVSRTAGAFTPRDRQLPDGLTIEFWRTRSHSFDGLASYRPWRATVGSGGAPDRTPAGLVSADFFPTLGVRAQFGRTFTAAEVRPGADDVVLLSYGYWRTRFGGDGSLVGRDILIDGRLCQVIGVLPADFRDLVTSSSNQPSVYLPISKVFEGPLKMSSGYVIGPLKSGIGVAAARSELAALAREAARQQDKPPEEQGVNITHLQDEIGFAVRPALLTMFAATFCILLIACTNIANLLLAQAIGRRQELAIRSALGAGRARLVRQLLTEALVLALAGALLGLCAAWALSRSMVALYPGTLPRVAEGGQGGAVLVFALVLAALSAAFFGILPALLSTRGQHDAGLRVGRAWMGRGARRWRDALISIQVAVTVTVLIAAGLLLRSFAALRSVDLGFEHARLFTAQVVLPEARYRTADDYARFAQAWVERLKTIPGVEEAAVTNSLPLAFNVLTSVRFDVAGQPEEHLAGGRAVAGDYFDAMGLRMREGRPLTAADDGRRDVVAVNESFVRRFLKSATVTGTAIRFGPRAATIVGVVRDLRNLKLDHPAEPEIYMPFAALPGVFLDTVVRAAVPPAEISAAARSQLRALDSGLALAKVSTMDRILDDNVAKPRFQAVLLALFAAVAVALAAIGVYGVTAQGVRSRIAEFGVRMALGARALDVFWLVERQGLGAPLLGLGVGLAAGWASGHLLNTFLYGVTSHDPLVMAGTATFILLVGLTGRGLPALQASRIDAARALRDE